MAITAPSFKNAIGGDRSCGRVDQRAFQLRLDRDRTVHGDGCDALRITFDGVGEDSRCPTGVQCVWAGDAAAAFVLERAPAAPIHRTLHTNGRFERQVEYEGFVIWLEDIKPYPKAGASIASG